MGQIEIKSMTLGMVATNCYLIINKETKEALLIDPADNALRISNVIEENVCTLKAILLTHGHFDHIMALNELKKRYNVPVYAHEEEEDVLKQSSLNMSGIDRSDLYNTGRHLCEGWRASETGRSGYHCTAYTWTYKGRCLLLLA